MKKKRSRSGRPVCDLRVGRPIGAEIGPARAVCAPLTTVAGQAPCRAAVLLPPTTTCIISPIETPRQQRHFQTHDSAYQSAPLVCSPPCLLIIVVGIQTLFKRVSATSLRF